jgi:hypothetical protein
MTVPAGDSPAVARPPGSHLARLLAIKLKDVYQAGAVKMYNVARFCLAAGLMLVSVAGVARAGDLFPPEWRGQPGSTYQSWTFGTNQNPASLANHFGLASAAITVGPYGIGWRSSLPGLGTQTGFWDLGSTGGKIEILIDNWSEGLDRKEVWVQVTCFKDITSEPTTAVDVPGHPECVVTFLGSQTALVEHVSTGGDWLLLQSKWHVEPSCVQERIVVNTDRWGSIIDEVVVDTIIFLTCDVNRDGSVDVVDLLYLVDAFGSVAGDANYDPRCDFYPDESIDVIDLLYLVDNFGRSIP